MITNPVTITVLFVPIIRTLPLSHNPINTSSPTHSDMTCKYERTDWTTVLPARCNRCPISIHFFFFFFFFFFSREEHFEYILRRGVW